MTESHCAADDRPSFRTRFAIVTALFCLTFPSPCAADDLHDWRGWFGGAYTGYAGGESDIVGNRFTYDSGSPRNEVNHDYSGLAYGGSVGYNFQKGRFVAGLELELAATGLSSGKVFNSDNDTDYVSVDWYGVLAGRLGLTYGRSLIYSKAGLAFAEIYNAGGDMDASGFDFEDAHIRRDIFTGLAVGGGLEQAVTDRLSVRLEFLHMDFGDYVQPNSDPAVPQQKYRVSNGGYQVAKFGLNFRF
jgi:outer membrane immunogenic protein